MTFRVDAYPTQTFPGTVSQVRLEPKTEQNVVSYTTMIDVPNQDLKLKPGMTANVTIQIASSRTSSGAERQPALLAGAELFARLDRSSRRRGDSRRPADDSGAREPPAPRQTRGRAAAPSNARIARNVRRRRYARGGAGRAGSRGADVGPRSSGRVWVIRDGKLQPVRVRTGVTDGAMTAIVDGDLKEGDQVVTGIVGPGAAARGRPTRRR